MSVSENRISCSKTIHFSVFLVRAQHRRRRRPSSFICWHNVCVRLLFVSLRWHVRQSLSMRLMNIQHFSRWWKQTPTATPPSTNERRSFIEFTEAVCVVSIISHIYIKMKMFKRIGVVIVHRATSDVCRKFIRNCENDAMTTNRIKMRFHHFFRSFVRSREKSQPSRQEPRKKTQSVLAVLTNNRARKKNGKSNSFRFRMGNDFSTSFFLILRGSLSAHQSHHSPVGNGQESRQSKPKMFSMFFRRWFCVCRATTRIRSPPNFGSVITNLFASKFSVGRRKHSSPLNYLLLEFGCLSSERSRTYTFTRNSIVRLSSPLL